MSSFWNAAGIVIFHKKQVALVYIERVKRWDIVFGHLEPGETPEQTVRREAMEEAGIILNDDLVIIRKFEDVNGHNIVYKGSVKEIKGLPLGYETSAMRLFSVPEAIELASEYMPINRDIILAAMEYTE